MNRLQKIKSYRGFTMIELLITMAIIGILATIIMIGFRSPQQKTRDAQRKSDLRQIASALELYYNDHEVYPPGAGEGIMLGCPAPTDKCDWGVSEFYETGGTSYFKIVPRDPLATQRYYYEASSDGRKYRLFAHVENPQDPDCIAEKCEDPTEIDCGTGTKIFCNFAITSANTSALDPDF